MGRINPFRLGPVPIVYSDPGSVTTGTRYMRVGAAATAATEAPTHIHINRSHRVNGMVVHAGTAPGLGQNAVFTLRKNGVDTALTVTLDGADDHAELKNVYVYVTDGDNITMRCVSSAGSAMANVQVSVDLY